MRRRMGKAKRLCKITPIMRVSIKIIKDMDKESICSMTARFMSET